MGEIFVKNCADFETLLQFFPFIKLGGAGEIGRLPNKKT